MLFCNVHKTSAVNVPVWLGLLALLYLAGSLMSLVKWQTWGSGLMLLSAFGLCAVCLMRLRWAFVESQQLVVRSVYGRTTLPLDDLEVGWSTSHSNNSGRSYFVYVRSANASTTLAEVMGNKSAERTKQKVSELFGGKAG
jgi:hypothetical protein